GGLLKRSRAVAACRERLHQTQRDTRVHTGRARLAPSTIPPLASSPARLQPAPPPPRAPWRLRPPAARVLAPATRRTPERYPEKSPRATGRGTAPPCGGDRRQPERPRRLRRRHRPPGHSAAVRPPGCPGALLGW